jgi:hypothetical protein
MGYSYWQELAKTPQKVRRRAFMTKSLAQMEESARHQSVHELKKVLGPMLLTVICLGAILGYAPLLISLLCYSAYRAVPPSSHSTQS